MKATELRKINGNLRLAFMICENHVTPEDVESFTTEELKSILPIANDRNLARAIETELKRRETCNY